MLHKLELLMSKPPSRRTTNLYTSNAKSFLSFCICKLAVGINYGITYIMRQCFCELVCCFLMHQAVS